MTDTTINTAPLNEGKVLRLKSTPMLNTAGTLTWARVVYQTEVQRRGAVAPFIAIFADGYGLGAVLAERLLRGETVYTAQGEEVLVMLDDEEARMYDTWHATRGDIPALVEVCPKGTQVPLAGQPADSDARQVESTLIALGRRMVEITTCVWHNTEWEAIPELWLGCMKERDELRRQLETLRKERPSS